MTARSISLTWSENCLPNILRASPVVMTGLVVKFCGRMVDLLFIVC